MSTPDSSSAPDRSPAATPERDGRTGGAGGDRRAGTTGRAPPVDADPSTSPATCFAVTARLLGDEARRLDLVVPAFRSPPRVVGVDRTVRRRGDHVTVSVRSRDRPWCSVVADLVEGVVVANELGAADAGRVRNQLWSVVAAAEQARAA